MTNVAAEGITIGTKVIADVVCMVRDTVTEDGS
jgi:hypothetical protein